MYILHYRCKVLLNHMRCIGTHRVANVLLISPKLLPRVLTGVGSIPNSHSIIVSRVMPSIMSFEE
jgi:hypothetical protein